MTKKSLKLHYPKLRSLYSYNAAGAQGLPNSTDPTTTTTTTVSGVFAKRA